MRLRSEGVGIDVIVGVAVGVVTTSVPERTGEQRARRSEHTVEVGFGGMTRQPRHRGCRCLVLVGSVGFGDGVEEVCTRVGRGTPSTAWRIGRLRYVVHRRDQLRNHDWCRRSAIDPFPSLRRHECVGVTGAEITGPRRTVGDVVEPDHTARGIERERDGRDDTASWSSALAPHAGDDTAHLRTPEHVHDRGHTCEDAAVSGRIVFNHLGQCVTDLERSRRFYEEALGFEFWRQIQPPDESSAQLLGLDGALGMTACYLRRDGLVLELLHFAAPARRRPPTPRAMDEPGLTHISLSCDIPATCARVVECGGSVLDATDIGVAVFVRDPDGQLIELLPLSYADHFSAAP